MIRQALQLQHSNVLFPGPIHMSQTCERDAYSISTDPDRLDVDRIHAYLVRAYCCEGIPRQTLERAITKSLCFGLFHGKDQVGFSLATRDAHGLNRQFRFRELSRPNPEGNPPPQRIPQSSALAALSQVWNCIAAHSSPPHQVPSRRDGT